MGGGLGGFLSGIMGGQNDAQSNVAGPNSSLYQLPGMAQNQAALQQYGQNAGHLQNTQQGDATRGQQQQLNQQLMQSAMGQGTSAADLQLQQSQDAQIAAARSAQASAGGDANQFLAARAANQQMGNAMAQSGAQMAIQRANEQQAAQQALGSQLQGQRSQDIEQANQQANLSQQGQQFALTGQMGLNQAQAQQNMALSAAQQQNAQFNTAQNMNVAAQNAQAAGSYGQAITQGVTGALSSLAMFSDERLKTDVDRASTDHQMDAFLDALDPASYNYINPKHGEGRHWSVMAQSAAKTPVGRSFVVDTGQGLALDTRKASAVALAALASMHRRVDKLENKGN